jgi:hypothetical protein
VRVAAEDQPALAAAVGRATLYVTLEPEVVVTRGPLRRAALVGLPALAVLDEAAVRAALAGEAAAPDSVAAAFEAYWADEVGPVFDAGRRPPIVAGFRRYAALVGLPRGDALGLVRDVDRLETAVLAHVLGAETFDTLAPIAWEAVGIEVYLVHARELVAELGAALAGSRVAGIPELVADLPGLAAALRELDDHLPADEAEELASALLGAALTVAFADAGWEVEALPGEPVTCVHGDEAIAPQRVIAALHEGTRSGEEWRVDAERLSLADRALGAARAGAGERQRPH